MLNTFADTLAALIDEGMTSFEALNKMNVTLQTNSVSVVDLLDRFEKIYLCSASEYEQNIKDDEKWDGEPIDTEFDTL